MEGESETSMKMIPVEKGSDSMPMKSPMKSQTHSSCPNAPPSQSCLQLPSLFDRSSGSWWNPKFDSPVLEDKLWMSYFKQTKMRFRFTLIYIIIASILWCLYFGLRREPHYIECVATTAVLISVILLMLGVTFSKLYSRLYLYMSLFFVVLLCCLLLSVQFAFAPSNVTLVGSFCAYIGILLILYTGVPMPMYLAISIGLIFSITYEVLMIVLLKGMNKSEMIIVRVLLHICIHVVGIHVFFTSQVQRHSTFMKIGQAAIARRGLQVERQIREKMIHSLMPPSVAKEVMQAKEDKDKNDEDEEMTFKKSKKKKRSSEGDNKGEIIFRSFQMNQMTNVSILFADIVGFTKMSSNKTAEHLVGLLNDLFGRFDSLCTKTGCEKISTLGDCYYCVSGCPEPREDHAKCCVEMGLGMITAIQQFDEDNNEQVNMRVGVHTGTVLCGIVGTRRFKFDVWSNDVTLANIMESTGQPGRVHISEKSYEFLVDDYDVEEGEECVDNSTFKVLIEHYDKETSMFAVRHTEEEKTIKTYFILGPKKPTLNEVEVKVLDDVLVDNTGCGDHVALMSNDAPQDVEGGGLNHVDKQMSEANGVTTAALFHRRHSQNLYSSEASLDKIGEGPKTKLVNHQEADEHMDKGGAGQHSDESDLQMIQYIDEDIKDDSYFYSPPVSRCLMVFDNRNEEEHFRSDYHTEIKTVSVMSPRFHTLIQTLMSFVVFVLLSICCFVMFDRSPTFIALFGVAFITELLLIVHVVTDVKIPERKAQSCTSLMIVLDSWVARNVLGAILACLPALVVYSNISCTFLQSDHTWTDRIFCLCVMVSLLNFCNFTTLSSWMKIILLMVISLVLLVILEVDICSVYAPDVGANATSGGGRVPHNDSTPEQPLFTGDHRVRYEIILNVGLLLLLLVFLTHTVEIGYRIGYHRHFQAEKDRKRVQENRDQADWLLHNIIPKHVSEVVKRTSTYSKNHSHVGVIFATIVNFNDFYDESYAGGREYLRVLNELISDYEDLLDKVEFKDVEKIKTISSSFMAASGINELNRSQNKHPYAHLFSLLDFCFELLNVNERFNEGIFNFDFIMNIGFNFGDVTAGVIGTTKLHYDIWGDTVNISSRMYSTGVANRVQMPESTYLLLDDTFEFEYRGLIFVKGKGDMKTYLLVKKRPGVTWD